MVSVPGRRSAGPRRLTPTRELARRARALGVAVFFISGRPPNLRDATERNLREQGYDPTAVILLPEGAHFKSAVDFKAPERRKLPSRATPRPEHGRSGERSRRRLRRADLQAVEPGLLPAVSRDF